MTYSERQTEKLRRAKRRLKKLQCRTRGQASRSGANRGRVRVGGGSSGHLGRSE